MRHNTDYEIDNDAFPDHAYKVRHYPGIAFYVRGWHVEPDEDTEWTGISPRTGNVIATMIGDDRRFILDPDDISTLPREDYCGECGQIGCSHDGLNRESEEETP